MHIKDFQKRDFYKAYVGGLTDNPGRTTYGLYHTNPVLVRRVQHRERSYSRNILKFQNLLSQDNSLKEFNPSFIFDAVKEVLSNIENIRGNLNDLHITEDESIHFNMATPNGNLYLELFFDNENGKEVNELVMNLFKNNKTVLAYSGTIPEVFRNLNDEINQEFNPIYLFEDSTNFPEQNEISFGVIATAEL